MQSVVFALGMALVASGGIARAEAESGETSPASVERSDCHPSYDPCVPIARDVDCAGGSGDGPAYVTGPVKIIGPDVYRLDRNNDGVGCE